MSKITALYLRLSVDDDSHDESDSIRGQRDLVERHISADPNLRDSETIEFVDDGWSGTSFNRPGVTALLEQMRRGEIGCIVVKDLSRWGRNYVEVCEYLEQIFPFLGVRFVSINDDYDSDNFKGSTAPMDLAFGSLIHEVYCKELSMKVRQSYIEKAKKGEFLCGVAPFGFIKSDTEKNKLVIDNESAAVVRHIFQLACEGKKTNQIATILNTDGVDSPLMYRKRKGRVLRGAHSAVGEVSLWTDKNVRTVLRDERYTGMQVSGKTRKPKPGSRNTTYLPESEWIKVPDAHDPIVSDEVFQKAQAVVCRYTMTGKSKSRALFAGKVYCGVCGHALEYAHRKQNSFYFCGSHSINPSSKCFVGRLYVDTIKEVAIAAVKIEAGKVLDRRNKRRKTALRESADKDAAMLEIRRLTAQTSRLERQSISLYEDFFDGILDRDAYLKAKTKCEEELSRAEARIAELTVRVEIKNDHAAQSNNEPVLHRLLDSIDVTDEVLSVIDRITVYDPERIKVLFSFGDTNVL